MKRSSGPRKTANFSTPFHHLLDAYAIAASAAGVSLLALAQPVEGKIVYTPANIRIARGRLVQLDLNYDGISDFSVSLAYMGITTFDAISFLDVTDNNPGNEVVSGTSAFAAALPKNVRVGSSGLFVTGSRYMALVGHDYNRLYGGGPWAGNKRAYLGLKFQIAGKTHYGWARLQVSAPVTGPVRYPLIDATLTGYAYETIPNKPIITGKTKGPDETSIEAPNASLTAPAPQTATLGVLALGAPALSIWRREESAVAKQ